MRKVVGASRAVSSAGSIDAALESLVRDTCDILEAERASLWVVDEARQARRRGRPVLLWLMLLLLLLLLLLPMLLLLLCAAAAAAA
jgi:hypothetical protein